MIKLTQLDRAAIEFAHRAALTPSPGNHDQTPPHPYCQGDSPCVCSQLYAACEDTAAVISEQITAYALRLSGKREQSVALTCAGLAVAR